MLTLNVVVYRGNIYGFLLSILFIIIFFLPLVYMCVFIALLPGLFIYFGSSAVKSLVFLFWAHLLFNNETDLFKKLCIHVFIHKYYNLVFCHVETSYPKSCIYITANVWKRLKCTLANFFFWWWKTTKEWTINTIISYSNFIQYLVSNVSAGKVSFNKEVITSNVLL